MDNSGWERPGVDDATVVRRSGGVDDATVVRNMAPPATDATVVRQAPPRSVEPATPAFDPGYSAGGQPGSHSGLPEPWGEDWWRW